MNGEDVGLIGEKNFSKLDSLSDEEICKIISYGSLKNFTLIKIVLNYSRPV
jgi:hypothetical protein